MIKTGLVIAAFVVVASGCAAAGAQEKTTDQRSMMEHKGMMGQGGMMDHKGMMGQGGMMDMKKMDTNGDGVISKEEFMSAHGKMFDQMKNKDGVIDLKNMPMCCKMMEQSKDGSK